MFKWLCAMLLYNIAKSVSHMLQCQMAAMVSQGYSLFLSSCQTAAGPDLTLSGCAIWVLAWAAEVRRAWAFVRDKHACPFYREEGEKLASGPPRAEGL